MKPTLAALFALALTGCEKPKQQVVVFDGWWAADFAKGECQQANAWWKASAAAVNQFGCDSIAGCSEMQPIYYACFSDPGEQVRIFEATLRNEFGSAATCQGVEFIVFVSSDKATNNVSRAMTKPNWSLIVDYVPGRQKQHWWLRRSDSNAPAEGDDATNDLAQKVCAIVNERGAKLKD
jgi:hypothetical protein